MSDELTPGRRYEEEDRGAAAERSELATALRALAQDHETPVAVPGTEIRRRAVRRRRRRKAALTAAGTACAGVLALVLAVVLTGGEDTRSVPPAASYRAPAPQTPSATAEPTPVPVDATVDLTRRELTAQGRTLPISSGTYKTPTPTGLMTVTAKYESKVLPGEVAGWKEYQIKSGWVMSLRGDDDRTTYLLALGWDENAPGNYDVTGGAIGLRSVDAMWLYQALDPGAVVQVVGATPTQPDAAQDASPERATVAPTESTAPPLLADPTGPTAGADSGGRPSR